MWILPKKWFKEKEGMSRSKPSSFPSPVFRFPGIVSICILIFCPVQALLHRERAVSQGKGVQEVANKTTPQSLCAQVSE
jgi:hypothetical protein